MANRTTANLNSENKEDDMDVQARYEQLVKSGATAISSDMLFGKEEKKPDNKNEGRWSTPATITALGERISDHLVVARHSLGSKCI